MNGNKIKIVRKIEIHLPREGTFTIVTKDNGDLEGAFLNGEEQKPCKDKEAPSRLISPEAKYNYVSVGSVLVSCNSPYCISYTLPNGRTVYWCSNPNEC